MHSLLTVVRCDRILWKSTIHPDPNMEELAELRKPRTRVGQFFVNALRPLTYRVRRGSTSSLSSGELSSLPTNIVSIAMLTPTHDAPRSILESSTPFSGFVKRSRSNDVLGVTKNSPSSISPSSLTRPKSSSRYDLRRSVSAGQSHHSHSHFHLSRMPSYPSSPAKDHSNTDLAPPAPSRDIPPAIPSRWRFFPFFNRDAAAPGTPIEHGELPISPLADPSKKGDVICLSYNTLDDREMRRLEGRSDHRPVIGSYAVYL
jgi:hypothetical protein